MNTSEGLKGSYGNLYRRYGVARTGRTVAYPEPIPRLSSSQSEEFLDRLVRFRLTKEQRQMYAELLSEFRRKKE